MMGTPGDLPQAPPKPVVFMEDLTDTQLAQAVLLPLLEMIKVQY